MLGRPLGSSWRPLKGPPVAVPFFVLFFFGCGERLEAADPPLLALRPPGPEIRSQRRHWTPRPSLGSSLEKTSQPISEGRAWGLGY